MHAWTVGVEDARDLYAELVLAVVIEKQGLRAPFSFIVTGARPDRVRIAPILFRLRVHGGISIDLAGRGLEDPAFHALCQPKHVDRTVHAGLGRLHGVVLIVDWRCRASEVVNFVNLHIQGKGYVVTHQLKARVAEEMVNVALRSSEEIIDA